MKNILILGAIIIVVMATVLVLIKPKETTAPQVTPADETITISEGERVDAAESPTPINNKLKADTFTGTLTKVDTGCLADGECFIEVDGKKVTALIGFSTDEVGSIEGVASFGDLTDYIGKPVEVYAQDNSDGTYTLYGSAGFYIKVLN